MSNLPDSLMTEAEAECLVELASGAVVLELGAWRGVQTAAMARVARRVWSIDRHTGDVHTGSTDTLPAFVRTLELAGVRDRVLTIAGEFEHLFMGVRYGMFDLVVIDGAHDADSLLRDWYLSLPLVRLDGMIVVHDWGRFDTLTALRKATGDPDYLVETLAQFRPRRYK